MKTDLDIKTQRKTHRARLLARFVFVLSLTQIGYGAVTYAETSACTASISKHVSFTEIAGYGTPYEVRIAAAEALVLRTHDSNAGQGVEEFDEYASLLLAISKNQLNPKQVQSLPSYRAQLAKLVNESKAIARLQAMENSVSSIPTNLSDLLAPSPQVQKKNFVTRLWSGTEGKSKLEFFDAEQFSNALETHPPDKRLEILRQNITGMPWLTHIEVFRILMALPLHTQPQGNLWLSTRVFGRLDFIPLAAWAEGDLSHLSKTVVGRHLKATGGNFELEDLLTFMRRFGMTKTEILNFMPPQAVTKTALLREIEKHGKLSTSDAYFYAHLAGIAAISAVNSQQTNASDDVTALSAKERDAASTDLYHYSKIICERGSLSNVQLRPHGWPLDWGNDSSELIPLRRPLAWKTMAGVLSQSHHFFSDSAVRGDYLTRPYNNIYDNIYDKSLMPNLSAALDDVGPGNTSAHTILAFDYLLNYMDPKAAFEHGIRPQHYGESKTTVRERQDRAFKLRQDFFAALNEATGAQWNKKALTAMGIEDDALTIAWGLLKNLQGQTLTPVQGFMLRAQVLRILSRPALHEMLEADKKRYPGVSLEELRMYMLSLLEGIHVQ